MGMGATTWLSDRVCGSGDLHGAVPGPVGGVGEATQLRGAGRLLVA